MLLRFFGGFCLDYVRIFLPLPRFSRFLHVFVWPVGYPGYYKILSRFLRSYNYCQPECSASQKVREKLVGNCGWLDLHQSVTDNLIGVHPGLG